mgnify:CR=1 FL=1
MAKKLSARLQFYKAIKTPREFDRDGLAKLLAAVDKKRIEALAKALAASIKTHLPAAVAGKTSLADYRTNPYVLMNATRSWLGARRWSDPAIGDGDAVHPE